MGLLGTVHVLNHKKFPVRIMHTNQIDEILNNVAVIPVIRLENENQTSGVGEALIGGGLSVIEVTLRSDYALSAISQLKQSFPSALIGAGTITNTEQYQASVDSGADFIISPGCPLSLLEFGAKSDIPLLPGVSTTTEAMIASEYGYQRLKLFPAMDIGGTSFLKSIMGPLPHLKFCPTGGISIDNAPEFLQLVNVMCVGGSWLTTPSLLKRSAWDEVRRLAVNAKNLGNF
jgi:2-dehydro-3-deoxyphosphogluconate aldolase/(4S)-4-hydroxy-2-oxoglutarate aldolase